ncbi:hypothetical protein HUJ04_003707 [Dendroctonus ponderosae]|nr:hypothetical protein HUJ04_003707 [Dendroctonus ponderosae]
MLEFYPHHMNLNPAMLPEHGGTMTGPECNGRTELPNPAALIKREQTQDSCEGCGRKIHDRYLMRVSDASWHEHCLCCSVCGSLLAHSCYTRNLKLYCKADYDRRLRKVCNNSDGKLVVPRGTIDRTAYGGALQRRLRLLLNVPTPRDAYIRRPKAPNEYLTEMCRRIFGVKCSRCGDRLLPQEMVMRAQQHVYHLPCFVCVVCCQPLQKGEQFVLRAGQLFCRQDFEKELYLMQQAHSGDEDLLDENSRPRDGRRGPKRPRTILTSAQRRQFKASFEVSPKPCRKVREALAKDTGLSVRVVQVWFQNQRAKMKKIQRKQKQEDGKSPSDKEKSDKEDKNIKQESSPASSEFGLGLGYGSSGQPLNPNMPYSPDDNYPAHSGESFCSSDISLDDSTNFDHLDEATSDTISLQNLELQSQSHHSDNVPSSVANPIDKLYLMQNSYFSTEQ